MRAAVAWIVVVASLAAPAASGAEVEVTPEARAQAARLYSLGWRLSREDGAHERAAVAFDAAFELDPDPLLLWNAARSWEEAGDVERAYARYKALLKREDTPRKYRSSAAVAVQVLGDRLREREERRRLQEKAAAARREADREARLGTMREEVTELAGTVSVLRERLWLAESELERDETLKVAGGTLVGIGAASLVTGVALFAHALHLQDRVESPKRDANGLIVSPTLREAQDLSDQARLESGLAIGGFVLGASLTIAGAVMLVIDADREERGPKVAPIVGPSAGGVVMGLRLSD